MTFSRGEGSKRYWTTLLLLLLAGSIPAGAVSPPEPEPEGQARSRKPAWKWTIDERLAARFDPEAMAAREAVRQAKEKEFRKGWAHPLTKEKVTITEPPAIRESLDGRKTPELFLPGELFDVLLDQGFPQGNSAHDLQGLRDWIEAQGAALGLGRGFWNRLEGVALPYLQEDRHPFFSAKYLGEEEDIRLCQLRAQALEAAKAEFGEEAFLRLLYETVAPNWVFARLVGLRPGPPTYERYEEELRFQEGGCR